MAACVRRLFLCFVLPVSFPLALCLLTASHPFGAGRAVFGPVRLRLERGPTLAAAFHFIPVFDDFGVQGSVQWEDGCLKPPAQQRIGKLCLLEMFADLLECKSNREIAEEKKRLEGELQKARMRTETVSRLYKKAFEKNAEGLLSDEGFLQITHEYDVEQLALKAKIPQLLEQIAEAERQAANKDKFIAAIRKFMQMDELTAPLLRELIDHIEVYETQGVGKSRTQRIAIHYRFVGYIDIPAAPLTSHYISETRQGVAVEYIPA